ncbi:hypothetical protein Aduo_005325 [Ancylostoma duodenale]
MPPNTNLVCCLKKPSEPLPISVQFKCATDEGSSDTSRETARKKDKHTEFKTSRKTASQKEKHTEFKAEQLQSLVPSEAATVWAGPGIVHVNSSPVAKGRNLGLVLDPPDLIGSFCTLFHAHQPAFWPSGGVQGNMSFTMSLLGHTCCKPVQLFRPLNFDDTHAYSRSMPLSANPSARKIPTRGNAMLDLVLSSSDFVHNVEIFPPFGTSDHNIARLKVVSECAVNDSFREMTSFAHYPQKECLSLNLIWEDEIPILTSKTLPFTSQAPSTILVTNTGRRFQ